MLLGNRAGDISKQDRTRSPLGHFRLEPPANDSLQVEQIRRCLDHGTAPVLIPNHPGLSAQYLLGIADQTKRKSAPRVLPEGIVILVSCLVDSCVTNNPLAELPAVFSRLGADPVDGDVIFPVSAVFIDKGRNLGPAPRSPLPAVEENNRSRRLFQDRWEFNRISIDILQSRLRESRADI